MATVHYILLTCNLNSQSLSLRCFYVIKYPPSLLLSKNHPSPWSIPLQTSGDLANNLGSRLLILLIRKNGTETFITPDMPQK